MSHVPPAAYASKVMFAFQGSLPWRAVATVGAIVAAFAVIDVAISQATVDNDSPLTLLLAVVTLGAVLLTRAHLLVALGVLVAASVTVSVLVHRAQFYGSDYSVLGADITTSLPLSFAELAGLGLLTALTIRASRHLATVVASTATAAAFGLMSELRWSGTAVGLMRLALAVGFCLIVGGGLYLRWLDHSRATAALLARQEERGNIARELHDLVAHHMSGIVLQARAARMVFADRPDVALDALAAIENAGTDALQSMRAMVGTLRSDATAPLAPTATIADIAGLASSGTDGGLRVEVSIDPAAPHLAELVLASLHRIAMEAVSNTRRHATGATLCQVQLRVEAGLAILTVTDDGRGADGRNGAGYGLIGIAERAAALGGSVTAGPRAAGGWTVEARVPTRVPSAHDATMHEASR
jgi:signal transduction histidine kinase